MHCYLLINKWNKYPKVNIKAFKKDHFVVKASLLPLYIIAIKNPVLVLDSFLSLSLSLHPPPQPLSTNVLIILHDIQAAVVKYNWRIGT